MRRPDSMAPLVWTGNGRDGERPPFELLGKLAKMVRTKTGLILLHFPVKFASQAFHGAERRYAHSRQRRDSTSRARRRKIGQSHAGNWIGCSPARAARPHPRRAYGAPFALSITFSAHFH